MILGNEGSLNYISRSYHQKKKKHYIQFACHLPFSPLDTSVPSLFDQPCFEGAFQTITSRASKKNNIVKSVILKFTRSCAFIAVRKCRLVSGCTSVNSAILRCCCIDSCVVALINARISISIGHEYVFSNMLEPRVADLLVLLLLLVAFPLAAYILLGKWSEASRRNERVAWLAQQAATEALRAESMTVSSYTPRKGGVHQCARCLAPATTRCAKCKSTRYCSGGCQILHWRQIHMYECQNFEITSFMSSPTPSLGGEYGPERIIPDEVVRLASSSESSIFEKVMPEKHAYKSKKAESRIQDGIKHSEDDSCGSLRQKSRKFGESLQTTPHRIQNGSATFVKAHNGSRNQVDDQQIQVQHGMVGEPKSKGSFSHLPKEKPISDTDLITHLDNGVESTSKDLDFTKKITDKASTKVCVKANGVSKSTGGDMCKPTKPTFNGSSEQSSSVVDKLRDYQDKSSTGSGNVGFVKIVGQTKSKKLSSLDGSPVVVDKKKKFKMLFPYGEFVRLFQYDDLNLFPRGLLNCGNSCYANAVLQCLIYTKPLIVYLLERLHSRSCGAKVWCLMCELERHAMISRNGGAPFSPSTILSHLRNINCQIGDGSQEDAHEFLRFLVTSMQSICLEGQGGEKKVDFKLQETTFVQHTFGGCLRSKVKCLNCLHESERYENIMDLTLEIYGWVESLEDALTQFTTPEDLDGENMYRCGRCSAYVRARKQLTIHEAPNILTIVLKRFQEGKYGKITKCITFPDLLDMVPFMTGKEDVPPLYLLYAVIVHVDTLNASFSGHYIAYVKDLQGNWFKVDDTEVQPVSLSQVMSQGAYILFYSRSSPRPTKDSSDAPMKQPTCESLKHSSCKTQKHSRSGQNPSNSRGPDLGDTFSKISNPVHHGVLRNAIRNNHPAVETFVHSVRSEFSDAASSDWSIFTCSDDASFTTESTRDSFSALDSVERCNNNVISSIFNTWYGPEHYSHNNSISFRTCMQSKPHTRFGMEVKGGASFEQQHKEGATTLIPGSSEAFPCSRNCRYFDNYGHGRTCHCDGFQAH